MRRSRGRRVGANRIGGCRYLFQYREQKRGDRGRIMAAIEQNQDTAGEHIGRDRGDMIVASEPFLDALFERCRAIQRRDLAAHPPGKRGQQFIRRLVSGNDFFCLAGFALARLTVRIERNNLRHAFLSLWSFPGFLGMLPLKILELCVSKMTMGMPLETPDILMHVMDILCSSGPAVTFNGWALPDNDSDGVYASLRQRRRGQRYLLRQGSDGNFIARLLNVTVASWTIHEFVTLRWDSSRVSITPTLN